MSGDVQPRKRKDKKKKKDDFGVEEPRGTAATLGEGDVFMHSYHEHGTGGHWCAKIIFFALLAVLVTLIGLIILENRGLTELEANSVETRYSGVLEGWIEDAVDDHHDEHTLELKHHDGEKEDEADDDDDDEEIEKIEKEVIDDSVEIKDTEASNEHAESKDVDEDDSDEDEPPIEHISKPATGKPFVEIEEETVVKPVDTLAEEDAYERQQEELRRQEEQSSHSVWLKLCVGGALLAATHAVLRRTTVRHADLSDADETMSEEAPTVIDRRMTIIEEPVEVIQRPASSQTLRHITDEEIFKKPAPVVQSPIAKPRIEEEIVKQVVEKVREAPKSDEKTEEEKELYSEEEEDDAEDNEDLEEDIETSEKEAVDKEVADESEPEPEPEEVSDVEIIYDETIEEEEEVEEEEISDVDDTELLNRLEAKYGRLPEPERPGQNKGGAKSVSSEWPGEPSDLYWRSQLDTAEEELRQGAWSACVSRVSVVSLEGSGRARWLKARALDSSAEAARDNRMLSKAITAYLDLLKMNERLSDEKLLEVARRTIDRINFRGVYLNAEPVYRLLIRRFPDDVHYRNNLTVSFLMANRADLADEVLRETLRLWPNDRVALAHHGFVLKNHYNKLEEAVQALKKALEGDAGQANEPRFYYHLGDALLLLGRFDEAEEIHKRGAELGHFLSPSQRSLYNVPRLRSKPWWRVEDTPYEKLAKALEASWREILKEGEAAKTLYEKEKEGLKERGEWSQMDIMVRGREIPGRCARAPVTCSVVKTEAAASSCKRGQVKFSMMAAGTHVRPHVGPTNCRLRMHLGLSNTKNTYIRVDKEIRQWQLGKTLLFDDSFEHEVWHNGTGTRLVLIVDVWHPDLTPAEKRQLPPI
ncbi:aspartyl/asparaginyl beta-hydroxylase isoform X3 [Danaus plexippus]|uniref:aspartyl/asparaginyl beta-hydroxylase isoform X3 n=1 Tax=Danaus plexippus TaxID=13037 RepID=UPI002AB2AA5E|nr:aspartyl/asparaginyl beta-hydroxylase isoform X3 [Danaus plexippus]